ncbi:MAG: hypothetical protein F6K19_41535 [Cyanothece sp. SIO1E1]|nr:hypothetical protein [Cyanothece sp. SIO1E1]
MKELRLKGSYLGFLILQVLSENDTPLSIQEIAEHLHTYSTKREQYNFKTRIRWRLHYFAERRLLVIEKRKKGRVFRNFYQLTQLTDLRKERMFEVLT